MCFTTRTALCAVFHGSSFFRKCGSGLKEFNDFHSSKNENVAVPHETAGVAPEIRTPSNEITRFPPSPQRTPEGRISQHYNRFDRTCGLTYGAESVILNIPTSTPPISSPTSHMPTRILTFDFIEKSRFHSFFKPQPPSFRQDSTHARKTGADPKHSVY